MTSNELALRPTATLAEKISYAAELAQSSLLPKEYLNNPANILLVMEFGDYLGIPPVASLRLIHVIDNKPTASAELIAGRVRQVGHKLRVTYDQPTKTAVCSIWRKDDPDFEFRTEWTWDRAKEVRDRYNKPLTDKANWKNYPGPMLKWRAITECARDACPEILLGVSYTSDELGAAAMFDNEADDAGLMTRSMRVEHNDLRREGEPPAGAVLKAKSTPINDEFYVDTPPHTHATDEDADTCPICFPDLTPADRSAMGRALSEAAIERLRDLNRQVLGTWTEHDVKAMYERILGEPFKMSSLHVQRISQLLEDALAMAGGDGEEASASLYRQFFTDNQESSSE